MRRRRVGPPALGSVPSTRTEPAGARNVEQNAHSRCRARTIWPNEADGCAAIDRQIDTVKGDACALVGVRRCHQHRAAEDVLAQGEPEEGRCRIVRNVKGLDGER